jgi:hypothetical protein
LAEQIIDIHQALLKVMLQDTSTFGQHRQKEYKSLKLQKCN